MKNIVAQLKSIIDTYEAKLIQLADEELSFRLAPDKWSKKEELGHLIDSAHNNLRRFIVSQYETNPNIIYEQDVWVRAANYAHQPPAQLIGLWMLVNNQICHVLESLPPETGERMCNTGKEKPELHTLNWLAEDYIKHLLHHLHHILEMEAVEY